ncbi:MAG TPA: NfeD family protein [Candidatus Binatia bacterium]|nr:NfeD family protein [Candidatus Binatia bacterium]
MHAGLAFVIGVLVTIAAFLFFAGVSGTAYYGLAVSVEVTIGASLIIVAFIIAVIFYVGVKAQYRRVITGKEALIGAKGIATSDLKPKGEVRVMGEFWEATTKDGAIQTGQNIEVAGMEGIFLVVKPVDQKA